MVEMTKPRLLEATQFTKEEFDKAKATSFAVSNEFKKSAMQMLAEMEKDQKSALNVRHGGIKNVRRVRVMKNGNVMGDDSWLPKNLSLIFDLLSEAKGVPIHPKNPSKPEAPKTFHLFMEVLSRCHSFLDKSILMAMENNYPADFRDVLIVVKALLSGDGSKIPWADCRQLLVSLFAQVPKNEEQIEMVKILDYLQSLMLICSIEGQIGPTRFAELAQFLNPAPKNRGPFVKDQKRPNRNGNGKPQERPVVQTKPQTPPQS